MTSICNFAAQKGDAQKPKTSLAIITRLFKGYLGKHLGSFITASLFMAVAAGTNGLFTWMLEPVVNGIFSHKGTPYLFGVTLAIIGTFVTRGITTYFHTVIMNQTGQRIVTDVQQAMFAHLLTADLAFFHSNASGKLLSRLTNDVAVMRAAVGECLTNSIKGPLSLSFLIGVMFYQDWRLSIITFLVFPISAWFVARMGKKMRRLSTNTQTATGSYAALLNQSFQGIRHVKAYGMEAAESERVGGMTEQIYKLSVKGYRLSALTSPIMELLSSIAIGALFIYGGWQADQGLITPGTLVSFVASFLLAYDPMKRMAKVNAQLQAGLAAAERVFEILDIVPHIVDAPDARALETKDYTIGIEDVVFRYTDECDALDHVSIRVPHGKTVAIVGPSGAGKSTIINLIPRFYDVQGGRITIGGSDIRGLTMASLRHHMALVSQETALFDDTIRANIAYGRPGASEEEIRTAAQGAYADAFIRDLPGGYDTIVGEHGVKLSGGQRQRIAIARAMLRNAPILLLDEATSALDNESERAVQEALKRLQEGRTTIVIAHRLSTIVDADLIVVMDRGVVVEQGTHAALLAHQGVYARLYGMQSGTSVN
jgi:subfamily B ATP-binding cassette protein MsbA